MKKTTSGIAIAALLFACGGRSSEGTGPSGSQLQSAGGTGNGAAGTTGGGSDAGGTGPSVGGSNGGGATGGGSSATGGGSPCTAPAGSSAAPVQGSAFDAKSGCFGSIGELPGLCAIVPSNTSGGLVKACAAASDATVYFAWVGTNETFSGEGWFVSSAYPQPGYGTATQAQLDACNAMFAAKNADAGACP